MTQRRTTVEEPTTSASGSPQRPTGDDAPVWTPPSDPAPEPTIVEPREVRVRSNAGAARRGRSAVDYILAIALVVAVGGIAFAGGRLSAPASSSNASANGFPGANGFPAGGNGYFPTGSFRPDAAGFGGLGAGGGSLTLTGTVTAVGANSITVKLSSGATMDVATDTSTTYHQQAAGSASDVQVGSQVVVETSGGFRGAGGPTASGAPGAAPGTGAGTRQTTARDIMVVAK
jgi:hypothetical protein